MLLLLLPSFSVIVIISKEPRRCQTFFRETSFLACPTCTFPNHAQLAGWIYLTRKAERNEKYCCFSCLSLFYCVLGRISREPWMCPIFFRECPTCLEATVVLHVECVFLLDLTTTTWPGFLHISIIVDSTIFEVICILSFEKPLPAY